MRILKYFWFLILRFVIDNLLHTLQFLLLTTFYDRQQDIGVEALYRSMVITGIHPHYSREIDGSLSQNKFSLFISRGFGKRKPYYCSFIHLIRCNSA